LIIMDCSKPDTFEFDTWVSQNKLTPLKSSLESLNLNTLPSILSLTEPLIDFILSSHTTVNALSFTQKNELKSRLLSALKLLQPAPSTTNNHKLNDCTANGDAHSTATEATSKAYSTQNGKSAHTDSTLLIVVTNEENKVLQSLKHKIKSVEQYEQKFSALQKEYELQELEATKQCTTEMENIEECINESFAKLHSALDKQHKALLSKAKFIKQSELRTQRQNHRGTLSDFAKDIKQCFHSLQTQKDLLTNSIHKYQQIMEQSTKSSAHLLEFDEDLSERQEMIASMGDSINTQFSAAITVWDNIIACMNDKFKNEFECDKHWTFIMSDTLKQLINDELPVGIINKIGCSNIIDVDWMDNGSLVLYTQSPLMLDVDHTHKQQRRNNDSNERTNNNKEEAEEDEQADDGGAARIDCNNNNNMEQLNNLQLLQYKVRYRYVVNRDADQVAFKEAQTVQESENERKESELDQDEADEDMVSTVWRNTEWTEVAFNNAENQFLSTIPLKIIPYCIPDEALKLWHDLRGRYQFRYLSRFIEIEIQICCQFKLKKECMSFWSKYCPIYTVNEDNAVLNDNVRIDNELNTLSFVLSSDDANHAQTNHSDRSNNNNGSLTFLPTNHNNNSNNNEAVSFMDSIPGLVMDQKEMETYSHLFDQLQQNNSNNNNNHTQNSTASTFQFNVSQILSSSAASDVPAQQQYAQDATQSASHAPSPPPLERTAELDDGEEMLFAEEQIGDTLLLKSGMVRAWRYDEEQDKWRGRGKGNLTVIKNTMSDEVRIIFKDVKHENKVRLLQRIDISYQHCTANYMNEIEWTGSDYSMDIGDPLNSLWKIKFIDEPDKVALFVSIFNDAVDECLRNID